MLFNLKRLSIFLLVCAASFRAAAGAPSRSGDDLNRILSQAADGSTVQLRGTFTAPVGTTYVVRQRLNVVGGRATLVNIRLIFLADVSISGLDFVEQDCTFHVASPQACTPGTPLLTLGYTGYTVNAATVRDVTFRFGRAYTAIAFGMGPISNVTIDGFTIVDQEMSGITALGGNHVSITNGSIVGGTQKNVDDGIALYSVYGALQDVLVQNVKAQNTFDLVGIGALLYYPTQNIQVLNSQCDQTAVCVYIKAGDQSPLPAGISSYSQLSHVRVSGITDTDSAGSRYISSIWIVGSGGATANDIRIEGVTARARASMSPTARIKMFTDGASHLSGITLSNLDVRDPTGTKLSGYAATEGMFIQDLGSHNISDLTLSNVQVDTAMAYGIDSGAAYVDRLAVNASLFTNMNLSNPNAPLFLIPYSYSLNGTTVSQ